MGATGNYSADHSTRTTVRFNQSLVPRITAAGALVAMGSVLLGALGACWFAGLALPEYAVLWISLVVAITLAVESVALIHRSRRQSEEIHRLEEVEGRLRAELVEQARSSQLAQQAAEENRKTIWKVFKASRDPMAVLDGGPDGIFLAVNQAFSTVYGYSRDEVLGKTPVQLNLLANPRKSR